MDSLIGSAARALAAGDPLAALQWVALREDPPALALRGVAMAQLGDYERARRNLRRAAQRFGDRERLARARCRVAEAEVALAARDLTSRVPKVADAIRVFDEFGDSANAVHARLVIVRRLLLVGDLEAAAKALNDLSVASDSLPPPLGARAELTRAELALRRIEVAQATAALTRARVAAVAAGIPALLAEIERVQGVLVASSARLIGADGVRMLRLHEVEALFASEVLVVDGCRRRVRVPSRSVSLARRPVLFALVAALAEAWPDDAGRDHLVRRAFDARVANESHRARLRVELGRLRAALRPLAGIQATERGFRLTPHRARTVAMLAPPMEGPAGAILALLDGGESWSTSALATATGASQRTVQRALHQFEEAGAVRSMGQGRSRRWLAPAITGFATTLLLPGSFSVR